ncbi:MAG: S41 family peptidase [Bacteroidota bacterium]
MNVRFLIALCCFVSIKSFGQATAKFSKDQVLADLEMLRVALIEAHYNLYAYTTEQAFDSTYKEVKSAVVKDSLSSLETINLFQRLVSTVDNGHTEIDFPGQAYGAYAYAGGTLFPLEVAFESDKALVRKNWSNNDSIKIGSELLRINGQPIADVLSKISPQISAERPYLKNAKIELYSFPRCYWQVFGQQGEFEIELRSAEEIKKYSIKAVPLIEGFEVRRTEVLNARMQLKFYPQSAYLNPGNFSGDESKYQQFLDSAFMEIRRSKYENLIIDLRNNGGGNDSFSDYLVSYFANKPFRWNGRFTLKTSRFLKDFTRQNNDTTNVYFREILTRKNGEIYEFEFEEFQPQPEAKRFQGNVFVLINRQSHSQSAVTAAQIQDYKFGTIIGEETGDYSSLYAAQFPYVLPNTGIPVKISKGYIVRVNGDTNEQGVIPDVYIKDHLLDEEDEILKGALQKIGEKAAND